MGSVLDTAASWGCQRPRNAGGQTHAHSSASPPSMLTKWPTRGWQTARGAGIEVPSPVGQWHSPPPADPPRRRFWLELHMRRSQCSPFSADPKMPQHHLQRSSRGLWTLPIKLGVHRGPWRAMVRRCGVAVTIRAQLLGRVACLRPTSRLWRTVPGLVGRSVRSLLLHVDAPGRGGRGVGGSPAGEPARAHAQ